MINKPLLELYANQTIPINASYCSHLRHFPSGVIPLTLPLQGFFIPTAIVELVLTTVSFLMIISFGRAVSNMSFTDSDASCTYAYHNILAKGVFLFIF